MSDSQPDAVPEKPHQTGLSNPSPTRLTDVVIKTITQRLEEGIYRASTKMPSENALCAEFQVSRTVVREAVASLRQVGRLVSKPGIGVFVAHDPVELVGLADGTANDPRQGLHIMELRMAIEVESAGLAAERRTPQDLADIVDAFDRFAASGADSTAAMAADIEFHLAIARASHNPHFAKILESSVDEVRNDLAFKYGDKTDQALRDYEKRIAREHGAIVSAISRRDVKAARQTMARHLADSIARYRGIPR